MTERRGTTRIKLCGLSRRCDIDAANALNPEYIGFVFAPSSRRFVTPPHAARLKAALKTGITAVGVFVHDQPEHIADLLARGIIDVAQLHGNESEVDIARLRNLTDRPIVQAFRIASEADVERAQMSSADCVLLDSGAGTGTPFDWSLLQHIQRPYVVAGGLTPQTVGAAISALHPFAVDVSSGIETDGVKDSTKMAEFVAAVRKDTV